MEESYDQEEVTELDYERDLLAEAKELKQDSAPVSVAEARSNSRFLTEESCGSRAPRFSNPTLERLNSFRYRKSPPKGSAPEPFDAPVDPRMIYQSSYESVETRQRTANPQISLRRTAMSRSSESLQVKTPAPPLTKPKEDSSPAPPVPAPRSAPVDRSTKRNPITSPAPVALHKEATMATPPEEPAKRGPKMNPATEFIPMSAPPARARSTSRSGSNSRSTTPTSLSSGNVRIPFSNSSRTPAAFELMSPIRQRNALEAAAAAAAAHADDPVPTASNSRSTTPTAVKRTRVSAPVVIAPVVSAQALPYEDPAAIAPTKADERGAGGWNSSVKVKAPTPNEAALARLALLQLDSGEKPYRPTTPQRTNGTRAPADSGHGVAVASRLFSPSTNQRSSSRSATPNGSRSTTPTNAGVRGKSNRASGGLLSPYNMMVSDQVLDVEKLTENDLKTIGKQLLLLKLLLESKMASDREKEEADLLHAWQTVHDSEEQARALAGQDIHSEETTRVHEIIVEMEEMVEKVTDHLAPVFERLSAYVKLKEDADNAANGEAAVPDEKAEEKALMHKELQLRLASLSKCLAVLKKHAENPDLVVDAENGGKKPVPAGADKMTRRLSLNSHVTASAAARRAESKAAHERSLAAAAVPPPAPAPTQPKPKPARHSMGATPTPAHERAVSPSAVQMTRRLSLNSRVTTSAALRRSEDKDAHEKAAAAITHTKVTPKPARVSLGATKSEPVAAVVSPPPAQAVGGRRLSLNSNVTASAAARRAEDKALRDKSPAAIRATSTPKSRTSLGSTKSEPTAASVSPKPPKPSDDAGRLGQRRVSLNSHLTASQSVRRAEIKQDHQPVRSVTTPHSPPKTPARSPHASVTHPAPFSQNSTNHILSEEDGGEHDASGDESGDAASGVQRRASLNSRLTASQQARRAEVKQEHHAVLNVAHSPKTPAQQSPKGPGAHPLPSPKTPKMKVETETDGGIEPEESPASIQRRLSLNSHLTASQQARRAEVKAEHHAVRVPVVHHTPTPKVPPSPHDAGKKAAKDFTPVGNGSAPRVTRATSGDSVESTVVEVRSAGDLFADVKVVAERQRSLDALFPSVEDAEPTTSTAASASDSTSVEENVTEASVDPVAIAEEVHAPAPIVQEVAVDEPISAREVPAPSAPSVVAAVVEDTPISAAQPAVVEEVSAPVRAPSPPITVDQRLDSMFAMDMARSEDTAEDARAPSVRPEAVAAPAVSEVPAQKPATSTAAAAAADIRSPERKARSEAFERLMKRMNTNKEGGESPSPSPVPGNNADSAKAAPAGGAVAPVSATAPASVAELDTTTQAVVPTTATTTYGDVVPLTSSTDAAVVTGASTATTTATETGTASVAVSAPSEGEGEGEGEAAPAAVASSETTATEAESATAAAADESAPVPVPAAEPSTVKRPTVTVDTAAAEAENASSETESSSNTPVEKPAGGVAALLSKFGEKPKSESAEGVSPKREKSTRVSELMNKYNSPKSNVPPPLPSKAPVNRGGLRSSVAALGDITPLKAVFEKDEEGTNAASAVPAPATSATESPAPASEPASAPTVSAPAQKEEPAAESVPASSVIHTPTEAVPPAAVATEETSIPETAGIAPEETQETPAEVAAPAPVLASEPVAAQVVQAPATESLESEKDTSAVVGEDVTASSTDPAVDAPTAAKDATPTEPTQPAAEVGASVPAPGSEVPASAPAETPSSAPVAKPPAVVVPSTESSNAPTPVTDSSKVVSTPKSVDGGFFETSSDGGSEPSTSSKKGRRPTFKGLWKRIKSATGQDKGTPFESEGWKPSPMLPEDSAAEVEDANASAGNR